MELLCWQECKLCPLTWALSYRGLFNYYWIIITNGHWISDLLAASISAEPQYGTIPRWLSDKLVLADPCHPGDSIDSSLLELTPALAVGLLPYIHISTYPCSHIATHPHTHTSTHPQYLRVTSLSRSLENTGFTNIGSCITLSWAKKLISQWKRYNDVWMAMGATVSLISCIVHKQPI